ncbi:DNA polymerase alpha catalytic subunit [Glycine max]|nr:DNA polymerase alpha catalytic subunit [Glycine max]
MMLVRDRYLGAILFGVGPNDNWLFCVLCRMLSFGSIRCIRNLIAMNTLKTTLHGHTNQAALKWIEVKSHIQTGGYECGYYVMHWMYRGCEPLVLSYPSYSGTFDYPPIFKSICLLGSERQRPTNVASEEAEYNFLASLYFYFMSDQKASIECDDETCKHTMRSINHRLVCDSKRGTVCPNYPRYNGRLVRKYIKADLYKLFSYFFHVFDTVFCIEKMKAKSRIPIEKELIKTRAVIKSAASTAQETKIVAPLGG